MDMDCLAPNTVPRGVMAPSTFPSLCPLGVCDGYRQQTGHRKKEGRVFVLDVALSAMV